jgi:hypothetical protein
MLPVMERAGRYPVKRGSSEGLELGCVYLNRDGEFVVNRGENIHFVHRRLDGRYPESKYKSIELLMADGWVID